MTQKGTLTRIKNELTQFFGKLVSFDSKHIEMYDTSPELSAFVNMEAKSYKGRLDSGFLDRLRQYRFYGGHVVTGFRFGYKDLGAILVLGLDLKRLERDEENG